MKLKSIAVFLLIFFAVGYGMSMIQPSLPTSTNPTFNYLETGGLTAFLVFLIWEKWGRKESGEGPKV